MKHWKHFTVVAFLAMLLLSSCWTTTPKVRNTHKVGGGGYTVRIYPGDSGASEERKWVQFSEGRIKYMINEFVKSKGYESYDAELTKSPIFLLRDYRVYTITMPGSTPVEDMEKIKDWHSILDAL
jgi:hypothetical protein